MENQEYRSFNFSKSEGLRIWCSGKPKYIKAPIEDTLLEICVLAGPQDLNILSKLIPKVKKLKIKFCDASLKRDLIGLLSLLKENGGNLEELIIERYWDDYIRLKNINTLLGKIDKFIIDKVDAKDYLPREIKNPKYIHIESFEKDIFHLKTGYLETKILNKIYKTESEFENWSNNIIIMRLSDDIYQIVFAIHYAEGQEESNTVKLFKTNKEFVKKTVFCKFKNINDKILENIDDFMILDDDSIDSLEYPKESYFIDSDEDEENEEEEKNSESEDEAIPPPIKRKAITPRKNDNPDSDSEDEI